MRQTNLRLCFTFTSSRALSPVSRLAFNRDRRSKTDVLSAFMRLCDAFFHIRHSARPTSEMKRKLMALLHQHIMSTLAASFLRHPLLLLDVCIVGCHGIFHHVRPSVTYLNLIMVALCNIGQTIIFSSCLFFFLSSFLFPRLISAVEDWMSAILPDMVWPQCEFRMQVWNVLHVARLKYRTQKSRHKSPSRHHCTTLSDFATKAHIDNRKKTC